MGYIIMGGIFVLALVLQSVLHHRERQDLYNRIMSRDFGEYQVSSAPRHKPVVRQNYLKKSIGNAYRSLYGRDETE